MKKKLTKIFGVGVTLALLSSLLIGVVPASADVSDVEVMVDDDEISASSEYIIDFRVWEEVPNDGTGTLIIEFPDDTDINVTADNQVSVQSESTFDPDNATTDIPAADIDVDGLEVTIDIDVLANPIGAGSYVRVVFDDPVITNPGTPDDYTLDVSTSEEEDPISSDPYEIKAPRIGALEGIVYAYNPGGILMRTDSGDGAITDTIDYVLGFAQEDWTIEVSEGEYDAENIGASNLHPVPDGVEIVATGNAEDTIITDWLELDGDKITFDGFTLEMGLDIIGNECTVQNCIFYNEDDAAGLYIGGEDGVVQDCMFDQSDEDSTMDPAVWADNDDAKVSDCEFVANEDEDVACVWVDPGLPADDVTIDGCSFAGDGGWGIGVWEGDVAIQNCTFEGLQWSLYIDGGDVLVDGNTFQDAVPKSDDEGGAIHVDSAAAVLVINNQILDTVYTDEINDDQWAIAVYGDAESINIVYNIITGNELAIYLDDAEDLNATHNYWGSDGLTDIKEDGAGDVLTDPILNASPSGAAFTLAQDELDAEDDCGVVIEVDLPAGEEAAADPWDPPAMMGACAYDSDPGMAAPPSYLVPFAYVDALIDPMDVDGEDHDADEILIKIFGNVDKDTVAIVWGTLGGGWTECSDQGVNTVSGFVWVKVGNNTVPNFDELGGTPFALADDQRLDEPMQSEMTPENGATDVRIKPSFSWDLNDEADSYEFQIAEDVEIGNPFDILEDSASTISNGHVSRDNLKYSTTYWWRVRTVRGAEKSDWTTAFFTTVAEPEPEPEPEPPIVVEEVQPPAITVEIPPAQEVQVIPDYLLWVVIGVAAVLVIAVIVLIVRTRRVA